MKNEKAKEEEEERKEDEKEKEKKKQASETEEKKEQEKKKRFSSSRRSRRIVELSSFSASISADVFSGQRWRRLSVSSSNDEIVFSSIKRRRL